MKRLVFIGGGIESKPALKHSKSLGYENILIDKDVNCPSKEFCDAIINPRWTRKLNKAIFNIIFSIKFFDFDEKNKLWKS